MRWSGEGGAFDWEEGISGAGWVDLPPARGKITGLYVMDGKIIAVREYGLTVISAYGTPENFKVEFTDTTTPRITPQTAAVVCGKLYFISDNRIFCFDGANIYPIACGLEEEINSPYNAVAYGESYLVCTQSKFLGRKAVFVTDTEKRTAYLADVAAVALCCGGKVCAVTPTQVCVLEKGGIFSFYSGVLNFDTPKRKFIKTVEISSDKTISMLISNGEQVRTFPNVQGRVSVNMSGKSFKVTLACNGAKVYSVKANAEVTYGI